MKKRSKKDFNQFIENISIAFKEVSFGVFLLRDRNELNVKWVNDTAKKYFGENILEKSLVEEGIIDLNEIYGKSLNSIQKKSDKKSVKYIIEGEENNYVANVIRLTKEFDEETYLVFIDFEKEDSLSMIDRETYGEIFEANWKIINNAKNPFIIISEENEILYSNEKAKELGLNVGFGTETNYFQDKINGNPKSSKDINLKRVALKKHNNLEVKIKDNYFTLKASTVKINSKENYYIVILNDITKRKKLENKLKELNVELEKEAKVKTKKLRKAYDDLKRLDSLRSDFVNIAGHELRTPLTSIMGYSELLLNEKEEFSEKQQEFLKIIFDECRHINNILKDMLDINKIQSGKYDMDFADHKLKEMIDEVENVFKIDFKNSKIDFIKILKFDEDTKIRCDRSKVLQVLKNLISNAIKFTDEGGQVTLNVIEDDNEFVFSVKDTGIGISKEEQDRIFEKFYQVGTHMRRNKSGSGLGLSIAREIISRHSGQIKVFSEKGYGSEFIFNIPKEIERKKKEKIYY